MTSTGDQCTQGEAARATGLPRHLVAAACHYRRQDKRSPFDADLAASAPSFDAAFGEDGENMVRHRFATLVRAWRAASADERQRFEMALRRLDRAKKLCVSR